VPIARLAAAQAAIQYPDVKINTAKTNGYGLRNGLQKKKLELA
jgi:hypothetical protein